MELRIRESVNVQRKRFALLHSRKTHSGGFVKPFPKLHGLADILLQAQLLLVDGSYWSVKVGRDIGECMVGCCSETDSQTNGEG